MQNSQYQQTIIAFLLILVFTASCDITKQKEVEDADAFLKIYNHSNTNLVFYPLDVIETADKGFLILNGVKNDSVGNTYPYSNLIKTTETGELLWTINLEGALSPVAKLLKFNENYAFLSMDNYENAYIIVVDPATGDIVQNAALDNIVFPLATYQDSLNNVLLLTIEPGTPSTRVYKFNETFTSQLGSASLAVVSTEAEGEIYRHAYKTGREFSFFAGEMKLPPSQTGYFVSCYYNSTLRTVFFDNGLSQLGNLYSFQQKDYIAAFTQKNDSLFSFIEVEEGRSILHGHQPLNVFESEGTREMTGVTLKKVADYYPSIRSIQLTFDNKTYTTFASSSNANDLLLFHLSDTANLVQKEMTVSFDDEVELRSIVQTTDGGVLLLAKYYVDGQYARAALRKIAKSKFKFD